MNNYILIPEDIKISKIPSGAKILYGDILYLSKSGGYCFASNNYFANIYSVHVNSISNWLKSLRDSKFISARYGKDDRGRSVRRLYPMNVCDVGRKKTWKAYSKNYNYKTKTKTKVVI